MTGAVRRGNTSIAASLLTLVLAVSLPLLAFAAYLVHSNTAQNRDLTVASAQVIARNVAAATDEFLDASRSAVPQLAGRLLITSGGAVICDPLLPEFRALMPRFLNVTVFDRRGNLVCSALPAEPHAIQASNTDAWFDVPMRERRSVLTGPRIGQISKKWVSVYAHPIVARSGEVAGVLAITIDLVDFQPVQRQAQLPPGSVAGIINTDGTLVSRSHEPAKWIGAPAPMPIEKLSAGDSLMAHMQLRGIDGVERLYAFAPIADSPWIAFAGLEAKALLARERRSLAIWVAFAALVIAIAAVAAFLLGRRISEPMRGMAEAARALAAGDGEPRASVEGPREMRAVATEFNRMVESRQRTETELRELAIRTRELAERLTAVEQSERARISRELHDRIGQNLAILRLNLDIIAAQTNETIPPEAKSRLEEARAMLHATIGHVRNVMAELRPPALDEYRLAAALRAYIASYMASTGLTVELDAQDGAPRLAPLKETALFRIAQEALTNAAKHARSQLVRVRLGATTSGVVLSVADDGSGFDVSAASSAGSTWGLTTMRERAEAIGGTLRIASSPGQGTTVVVEVPY